MDHSFKMEALEGVKSELPDSVAKPKPKFKSPNDAIQFYSAKLEQLAQSKTLTLDELKVQANLYKFGPDESFMILGLFDSIRALKSAE